MTAAPPPRTWSSAHLEGERPSGHVQSAAASRQSALDSGEEEVF